jgi:hypothetical protein
MAEEGKFYISIGLKFPLVEQSQMFGKPCFKINGKAFVCFFDNCMVFKLPATANSEALSLEGSKLFDPAASLRSMKEWVQVPYTHKMQWEKLAQEAYQYVRNSTG